MFVSGFQWKERKMSKNNNKKKKNKKNKSII